MMRRVVFGLCVGTWCMLMLLCSFGMPSAFADGVATRNLSIVFKYEDKLLSGAKFSLYHVGSFDDAGIVQLDAPFASSCDLGSVQERQGWARSAQNMGTNVVSNKVDVDISGVTDDSGTCVFTSDVLSDYSVYLVVGSDVVVDGVTYSSTPFLISIPMWDAEAGAWVYEVVANPKSVMADAPGSLDNPSLNPKPVSTATSTEAAVVYTPGGLAITGDMLVRWSLVAVSGLCILVVGLRLRRQ